MPSSLGQTSKDSLPAELASQHDLPMSLRRAYLALHRATNACLADKYATADQFVVLTSLAICGPLTQTELAQRTFSDRNTISAMLDRLQEQGYITRKRHRSDGRVRLVSLTRSGRHMQSELSRATKTLRRRLEGHIASSQLTDLAGCLNGIAILLEGHCQSSRIEPNPVTSSKEKDRRS
jgi:DNA-binding MarR family transcriptional regulator